ncbi:uncharacterized protein EV422DRAFT_220334 [Fimicolochytrium jonesii]|uniref:uncharacterized protein n=1 Tax=Fimicolochytrium jonesii TaxID=1396493 RepID=UPI0022FE520D|nr:uncharacterized protein EV422DRAFT_220334 [Fimicolochytrium jonesii]KAI8817603.1 hypothetical protein EV422DRAFT_220334 [Fimicolochytrium jonesii]
MTTEPVQPAKRRPGRPPLNRSVGQTRNEPAKVKAAPPTSHPHAAASRPGRPRGSGLASRGTRGRGSSNGNALVTGATRGRPRSSKDSHPIKNPIKSAGRYPAKATTARKAKSKDAGARMNGACTDSDEEPLSSRRASLLPAFEIHKRHVIDQRKQRLGQILDSYDSRVREMYYLENQLPLLEYDPAKLKVDKGERIAKVVTLCRIFCLILTCPRVLTSFSFRSL